YGQSFAPPRFRPALRLDHGRRQSRAIPSLAELAAHRAPGPDRGDRSSPAEFSRADRAGGAGARALSHSRKAGWPAAHAAPARLGFPHGTEDQPVLDGAAQSGWELEERNVTAASRVIGCFECVRALRTK